AGARAARLIALGLEAHVVPDVEIEPAVAVVVEERGAHAPAVVVGACLLRDVAEPGIAVRAGTLVVPELVRAHAGDVEIGAAVVVVVSGGGSHAVGAAAQAAAPGDVGE